MLKKEKKTSVSSFTAIPLRNPIDQLAATFALGDLLTNKSQINKNDEANPFDDIRSFSLNGTLWIQK